MATPSASQTLKAVVVLEKDVNGDVLSWSFPAVEKNLEIVIKQRSGLIEAIAQASNTPTPSPTLSPIVAASLADAPYRFSRYGNQWIHILSTPLDSTMAKSKKVIACSIAIISSSYNPQKYNDLAKIFLKAYTESELSPIPIMESYLSILTTNKYNGSFGSFDDGAYDARRAMIAPVKFLIQLFGADSINIWIAMLLKKRVIIYHPRLSEVQNLVKIFPLLGAWHRQDLSLLRPFVNLSSELEVSDLVKAGVYVAGVTDPEAQQRKDLFDLYIDATTKTFTFPTENRPNDFNLTKFHRTTAETFVKATETENDQGVIKVVAQQTKEFLDKLASLKSDDSSGAITSEGLAAAGLPQAMQNWILAVASAEGLTKKL